MTLAISSNDWLGLRYLGTNRQIREKGNSLMQRK
jgi:hypothetical protein